MELHTPTNAHWTAHAYKGLTMEGALTHVYVLTITLLYAVGETYVNECILDCAGVQKDYDGECFKLPCKCSEVYGPVCGLNGVTYLNECNMICANVSLDHDGECELVQK